MNALRTAFGSLLVLIALPIVPVAEDRIVACRLYGLILQPADRMRQSRDRRSLLCRLRRAAGRQVLMNSINLPGYLQLKARIWQRGYNYGLTLRILGFCFAAGYGSTRLELLLMDYCPAAYSAWMWACGFVIHSIDAFWKAVTPSLPPWS